MEKIRDNLILVQIYVYDIIFGSTDPALSIDFENLMKSKFDMSIMGKIYFFFGLNILQSKKGIVINQESYKKNFLEHFRMENCSHAKVTMVFGTRLSPSLDKLVVVLKNY